MSDTMYSENSTDRSPDEIVYQLTVGDIQTVARAILHRSLSEDELTTVINELPDIIDWFDTIERSIEKSGFQPSHTASGEDLPPFAHLDDLDLQADDLSSETIYLPFGHSIADDDYDEHDDDDDYHYDEHDDDDDY